jgi:hypothetical protein
MNDELERIWKRTIVAEMTYSADICLERLKNITKYCHSKRCPDAGASLANYRSANPIYYKLHCSQNQSLVKPGVALRPSVDPTQCRGMGSLTYRCAVNVRYPQLSSGRRKTGNQGDTTKYKYTADDKTKVSGLNGSKHYPNSVSS